MQRRRNRHSGGRFCYSRDFLRGYLVIAKLRLAQQFNNDFECIIERILQTIPMYGRRIQIPRGFHFGSV